MFQNGDKKISLPEFKAIASLKDQGKESWEVIPCNNFEDIKIYVNCFWLFTANNTD